MSNSRRPVAGLRAIFERAIAGAHHKKPAIALAKVTEAWKELERGAWTNNAREAHMMRGALRSIPPDLLCCALVAYFPDGRIPAYDTHVRAMCRFTNRRGELRKIRRLLDVFYVWIVCSPTTATADGYHLPRCQVMDVH